ncbi:MAG: adenylate/guanylate cyclase domain-containing protein [Treponema sp.]|nr:adenylate/guanylate cyclase domain-containing protein [Treponema sp.]
MSMKWKTLLCALVVSVFFSIIYAIGVFGSLGYQVYDFFLRFRAERVRDSNVVFLNVDDNAIAYNGVFPWPRSVTADGILRLKEYGLHALIFDIEFIDRGHQGVDTLYLNRGLPADFDRSFSEINSAVQEIFGAVRAGMLHANDIDRHTQAFTFFINEERLRLLTNVQRIARDNDEYLFQASELFGRSWVTLNLRSDPLRGEQAERRSLAEEHFSHNITASDNAHRGNFADILPPLPGLALSAKGAGFTNVEIDADGIRRRLYLAQNVHDHWYLQLVMPALIHYLGYPDIELERRRLTLRDARLPSGEIQTITIPLDTQGRMIIDWPPQNYFNKFRHVSFVYFALLDDIEAGMEEYIRALNTSDILFFSQADEQLERAPFLVMELTEIFDAILETRNYAMQMVSTEMFDLYVELRRHSRSLIRELLDSGLTERIISAATELVEQFPWLADEIIDEAEYIVTLAEFLDLNLTRYEEIDSHLDNELRGKFAIMGRVDTGTTDIGSNPFWGEYINVGTHGVVLDMILSGSFITFIDEIWIILFTIAFVMLFFAASAKLPPLPRTASGFIAVIVVIGTAIVLFRFTGLFFNPLVTTFAMVGAVILREVVLYASSEREKQFIRKAFSTYVSNEVVQELIDDPSRLQLGGTKRNMSALFTDLKGFATLSEKLDPESLVSILNRYLTAMSDIVLAEKGTIDKFIGDAIVAFFGAPSHMPDHALKACISALTMKRIEKDFNKTLLESGLIPVPLLTRIGINTGSMVAGNMGTENKMNYTIMGNAVNLAARLEGANKQYGTWILASDATVSEAGSLILSRRIDRIRVIGINEPIQIHELLNTRQNAPPQETNLVNIFHQALDYYEKHNWKDALEGFKASLAIEGGGPSEVYIKRCETFLTTPPPADWDGVYNLTEK